jgi:hypothetical protein
MADSVGEWGGVGGGGSGGGESGGGGSGGGGSEEEAERALGAMLECTCIARRSCVAKHINTYISILFYSTLLYSTLLSSILLYSILLYWILLYSILLYTTLSYSTLLCSTLLYPTLGPARARPCMNNIHTRTLDAGSRIQDPGSMILIQGPGSWILDPR